MDKLFQCLGWCLLFCGGVEIFKMDPMEGEIYFEENIKEDNELDGNELNEESQHCIDGCAAPNDINEDELETREQPLLSTGDFPDPKNNFSLDPNLEVEEQETRTLDGSIVDPKTTLDHNDSLKDQIKSSEIVSPDTIVEGTVQGKEMQIMGLTHLHQCLWYTLNGIFM